MEFNHPSDTDILTQGTQATPSKLVGPTRELAKAGAEGAICGSW